jgi:type VI secretion system secreted protein VgrG
MEQEGMYYYFKHEDGKHTLVLSDSISAHETESGYEEVPYYPPEESERRERDHISDWSLNQVIQPGMYTLNDYDFKKPRANLEVKSSVSREHDQAEFEIYDYPGEYKESGDGEGYVRARIEELQAQYEEVQGQGNVAGLCAGCLFKLTNYPREDQNREYLVTAANYNLGPQEYESAFAGGSGSIFSCGFTAIDKKQAFRAPRVTPKPIVQGPQTATVVGKAGEAIWTDKYGRVKVQFHWDRYGKEDENSSSWIRVSQNRAGKGWGESYIPHVGQEVIVSFLEGDPDRPIVTGRVYNADNMPPLELPANKTKTAMRDHGGSEIVMEGDDGGQRITMFSPSGSSRFSMGAGYNPEPGFHWDTADNWSAIVGGWENKEVTSYSQEWIGGTKLYIVEGTVTEEFNTDLSTTIAGSKTEKINGPYQWFKKGAEASINLSAVAKVVIGAEASANLSAKKSFTAGIDDSTFIGAKISKQAGFFTSVTAGRKLTVDLAGELNKKADEITAVDGKIVVTSGGPTAHQAGGLMYLTGKPVEINGGGSVKITAGGATIILSGGDIGIKGGKIQLTGNVTVLGDLDVTGTINDK